ncbi:MAG: WD40 repeat domain-containing protein [Aggregatilineales bacterium]
MRKNNEKRKRGQSRLRTLSAIPGVVLAFVAAFVVQRGISQEVMLAEISGLAIVPETQTLMIAGWRDNDTFLEQRTLTIADNLSGVTLQYDLEQNFVPSDVQVSPAGTHIALSSLSTNSVVLYETGFSVPIQVYSGQRIATFSPDNRFIALAGDTGGIRLLMLESGEIAATIGVDGAIGAIAFSPDGRWLSASTPGNAGTQVLLWQTDNLSDAARAYDADNFVYDMTFTPDSKHLVLALDGRVQMIDLQEDAMRFWDLEAMGRVSSVAVSADGTWLAAGGDSVNFDNASGVIAVWRLPDDALLPPDEDYYAIKLLSGHTARVNAVAFSWDDGRLFSVGSDGTLRLWDIETQQQIEALER